MEELLCWETITLIFHLQLSTNLVTCNLKNEYIALLCKAFLKRAVPNLVEEERGVENHGDLKNQRKQKMTKGIFILWVVHYSGYFCWLLLFIIVSQFQAYFSIRRLGRSVRRRGTGCGRRGPCFICWWYCQWCTDRNRRQEPGRATQNESTTDQRTDS